MTDRLAGLALFLPVPIVLGLFTQAPLGVLPSLALGTALMLTHRLYARPFALARATRRCLWCGGIAGEHELPVVEPFGATAWRACSAAHASRVRAVLGWAESHAVFLKAGILGTLVVFLPAAALAGTGRLAPLILADTVALFRLGIAFTVLPLGWLALHRGAGSLDPPHPPFPVHIQALIGTAAVVWLFRLVGLAWLVLGTRHIAGRVGL